MNASRTGIRHEWLLAAGLIFLALVPLIAGGMRLGEIVTGAPETPTNARFVGMPVPVVLHIVGALVYAVVGAFQFLPGLRRRHLPWHRFAGRYLLVPAGVIVAVTGLWMTAFYDVPPIDDGPLTVSRYLVGLAMLVFLALGVAAIVRREYVSHGAWMIRAYALAMGAGTQVFTSAPFVLAFGEPDAFWRTVQMDAGWLINLAIAEWVIARRRRSSLRRPRRSAALAA